MDQISGSANGTKAKDSWVNARIAAVGGTQNHSAHQEEKEASEKSIKVKVGEMM